MNQLEQNIMNSFRLAKSDIIQLQSDVINLGQAQERVMELLDEVKEKELQLYHRLKQLKQIKPVIKTRTVTKPVIKTRTITKTKVINARAKKTYVASKEGKKFHLKNCPYAQNIKPKSKLIFKTKASPLNKGYKACKCIK